jgi:hypothetical protein
MSKASEKGSSTDGSALNFSEKIKYVRPKEKMGFGYQNGDPDST